MSIDRERAEDLADEMILFAEETGRRMLEERGETALTPEERAAKGVPNIKPLLREKLIEALMAEE